MLICVGLAVDYAAHIAHMFKVRCQNAGLKKRYIKSQHRR